MTKHKPKKTDLHLIGAASCIGAGDKRCELAPQALQAFAIDQKLSDNMLNAQWHKIFKPAMKGDTSARDGIRNLCAQLANSVFELVRQQQKFVVFGGDHSCAIGTWSGVSDALFDRDQLGLIWIDAHMDSHLPETTPSGNIHGMPLACLLGHGDKTLREIHSPKQKLLPQNVCLIGIRSFEEEEAALLKILGVKIYYMDEVNRRGINDVLHEAVEIISQRCRHFGISIDLDALDPQDAPGVGSPAANGIHAQDLEVAFAGLAHHDALVGVEITEYNPAKDINDATANVVVRLLRAMFTRG